MEGRERAREKESKCIDVLIISVHMCCICDGRLKTIQMICWPEGNHILYVRDILWCLWFCVAYCVHSLRYTADELLCKWRFASRKILAHILSCCIRKRNKTAKRKQKKLLIVMWLLESLYQSDEDFDKNFKLLEHSLHE